MTTSPSILLVGGCGYIGTYIYSQLMKEGIALKVCDRLSRGNPLNIPVLDFDYSWLTSEFASSFDAIFGLQDTQLFTNCYRT